MEPRKYYSFSCNALKQRATCQMRATAIPTLYPLYAPPNLLVDCFQQLVQLKSIQLFPPHISIVIQASKDFQ